MRPGDAPDWPDHRVAWQTALPHAIAQRLRQRPGTFYPAARLLRHHVDKHLRRDHDLLIEAFPRSGNTFAYAAFQQAQQDAGGRRRVCAHLHAPAQIARAARYGVPALVIARRPEDAVTSFVIRYPELDLRRALASYVRFYTTARRWADHTVAATFSQVIGDLGRVIGRINDRFSTDFAPFTHTPANEARVFEEVDAMDRADRASQGDEMMVARPSDARGSFKQVVHAALARPRHADALSRAQELYDEHTARAGA